MSAHSSTGALASFAMPMFTMSSVLRLISAGLPAPSKTMISWSDARLSKAAMISGMRVFFMAK